MNLYASKHYKKLIIIPLIIGLMSLFFVTQVKFGIELKGGVLMTAPTTSPVDTLTLEQEVKSQFAISELSIRQTQGLTSGIDIEFRGEDTLLQAETLLDQGQYQEVIDLLKPSVTEVVETPNTKETAEAYFGKSREQFKNSLITFVSQKINVQESEFSVQDIGPSLGAFFWKQASNALFFAFVLVALLVFFFFRNILISVAIIQSSIYDVLFGLGAMGLLGIPLSLATMAPLLMIIGYSVDTDIMLTERVLKRKKGTPAHRAASAFKTGITMTATTAGAMISLYLISSAAGIGTLSDISLILLFGLLGDIMATWLTNAPIVLWAQTRQKKKK